MMAIGEVVEQADAKDFASRVAPILSFGRPVSYVRRRRDMER